MNSIPTPKEYLHAILRLFWARPRQISHKSFSNLSFSGLGELCGPPFSVFLVLSFMMAP